MIDPYRSAALSQFTRDPSDGWVAAIVCVTIVALAGASVYWACECAEARRELRDQDSAIHAAMNGRLVCPGTSYKAMCGPDGVAAITVYNTDGKP